MTLPGRSALPPFVLLILVALVLPCRAAGDQAAEASADPSTSVVKIYVAAVTPDAFAPWRPGWSFDKTGSGAVIAGRRILTNAHVVEGHTFVQVRFHGRPEKHPARVTFVSHTADLALLELEDPAHLDGIEPLALGDLPAVQAEVAALGFPSGGDTLSVTSGVVTRIEHVAYVQSWERLLAIQMDAAIAAGSSGGPLIHEGRLVGVAAQSTGTNDMLGCAVAVPVVRQFLDDVADGRLDGLPSLRIRTQKLENPALRASLRVPDGESGVLVKAVPPASPAAGLVLPGDVLTTVDGLDVANDGTVELRGRERTDLAYGPDRHQVGETVSLRFLRDGAAREAEVALTLAHGEAELVPTLHEEPGDYYIFVTFEYRRGGRVTLHREEARRATPGLLQRHGITSDRSKNLRRGPTVASHPGGEVTGAR